MAALSRLFKMYITMCLVTITSSQTTVCVWNSIDDLDHLNGEYTMQPTSHNGYPYWKQAPTPSPTYSPCPETRHYIFMTMDYDGYQVWSIDSSKYTTTRFGSDYPNCEDHYLDYGFPDNPTQCQEGYYIQDVDWYPPLPVHLPLTITDGSCPSLPCDAIKIANSGDSRCDTTFVADHSKHNFFVSDSNIYFFFHQYIFRWECTDTLSDSTRCDGSIDPITVAASDEWQHVSLGSFITMDWMLDIGDSGTELTMECIQFTPNPTPVPTTNTVALTVAPTLVPTLNPSQPPTVGTLTPSTPPTSVPTVRTSDPTIAPTPVPTLNPSQIPTVNPTVGPIIPPTFVSTVIPSGTPTLRHSPLPTRNSASSSSDAYENTKLKGSMVQQQGDPLLFLYISIPVVTVCILGLCVVCIRSQGKHKKEAMVVNKVKSLSIDDDIRMMDEPVPKAQNIAHVEHKKNERAELRLKVADWLKTAVGLTQYYALFVDNGYDTLRFIQNITDISQLEELGIESVDHQRHILSEIQLLSNGAHAVKRNDAGSDEASKKVESWLQSVVELPQYHSSFVNAGFEKMEFIRDISDISILEAVGIESVEHQQRVMSHIHDLNMLSAVDEFVIRGDEPSPMGGLAPADRGEMPHEDKVRIAQDFVGTYSENVSSYNGTLGA